MENKRKSPFAVEYYARPIAKENKLDMVIADASYILDEDLEEVLEVRYQRLKDSLKLLKSNAGSTVATIDAHIGLMCAMMVGLHRFGVDRAGVDDWLYENMSHALALYGEQQKNAKYSWAETRKKILEGNNMGKLTPPAGVPNFFGKLLRGSINGSLTVFEYEHGRAMVDSVGHVSFWQPVENAQEPAHPHCDRGMYMFMIPPTGYTACYCPNEMLTDYKVSDISQDGVHFYPVIEPAQKGKRLGDDFLLKRMVAMVAQISAKTNGRVDQRTYVLEECSELIKELTKDIRDKGERAAIVEEAADVLGTIEILLAIMGVDKAQIPEIIRAKRKRALSRWTNNEL